VTNSSLVFFPKKTRKLQLTDNSSYDRYARALGKDKVVVAPMSDIWMRDLTTSNPVLPVMFRYTAAGQGGGQRGQSDADSVQETLAAMVEDAAITFRESDLLNDGGNFVDDYAGNVVVSRKFLHDNKLTEARGREALRKLTKARNVAFIDADEQGGLEHADGVVSFVDTNTLLINSYPEDPGYSHQLKADLRRGLPGVKIHEIITPYDGSQIYDERFGSACGLYTNALVTPERIYFPQFGVPEDKIALEQVKVSTTREVIPVSSQQVCQMGGGVRCMSWQLRGESASSLKAYFAVSE
jgi:agmatine deiminase